MKLLAQCHIGSNWQNKDSDPDRLAPESVSLTVVCVTSPDSKSRQNRVQAYLKERPAQRNKE